MKPSPHTTDELKAIIARYRNELAPLLAKVPRLSRAESDRLALVAEMLRRLEGIAQARGLRV